MDATPTPRTRIIRCGVLSQSSDYRFGVITCARRQWELLVLEHVAWAPYTLRARQLTGLCNAPKKTANVTGCGAGLQGVPQRLHDQGCTSMIRRW